MDDSQPLTAQEHGGQCSQGTVFKLTPTPTPLPLQTPRLYAMHGTSIEHHLSVPVHVSLSSICLGSVGHWPWIKGNTAAAAVAIWNTSKVNSQGD